MKTIIQPHYIIAAILIFLSVNVFSKTSTMDQLNFLTQTSGNIEDIYGDTVGEVGRIQPKQVDKHRWNTIQLSNTYINPVVVALRGSHPAQIELKKVNSESFQYKAGERQYSNEYLPEEGITYVVIEAGIHTLNETVTLQALATYANHNFTSIYFNQHFTQTPAVISQSQSSHGNQPIVIHKKDIRVDGLQLSLQAGEGDDAIGAMKPIGLIAITNTASNTVGDATMSKVSSPSTSVIFFDDFTGQLDPRWNLHNNGSCQWDNTSAGTPGNGMVCKVTPGLDKAELSVDIPDFDEVTISYKRAGDYFNHNNFEKLILKWSPSQSGSVWHTLESTNSNTIDSAIFKLPNSVKNSTIRIKLMLNGRSAFNPNKPKIAFIDDFRVTGSNTTPTQENIIFHDSFAHELDPRWMLPKSGSCDWDNPNTGATPGNGMICKVTPGVEKAELSVDIPSFDFVTVSYERVADYFDKGTERLFLRWSPSNTGSVWHTLESTNSNQMKKVSFTLPNSVKNKTIRFQIMLNGNSAFNPSQPKIAFIDDFKIVGSNTAPDPVPNPEPTNYPSSYSCPQSCSYCKTQLPPAFWVQKTANIKYGQAYNKVTEKTENLYMDFYRLPQSDKKLPVVVYVHGGGYDPTSSKNGGWAPHVSNLYARQGFFVASIEYRRYGWHCTVNNNCGESTNPTLKDPVHDAKAAVRYLRKHADALGIDTSKIVIQGCSAGAQVGMNYAAHDWGEGSSGNPGYSSKINGVVSHSGTVSNSGAVADFNDMNSGDLIPPSVMFHNQVDPLVPFKQAENTHLLLNQLGAYNNLIVDPGEGHCADIFNNLGQPTNHRYDIFGFMTRAMNIDAPGCPSNF